MHCIISAADGSILINILSYLTIWEVETLKRLCICVCVHHRDYNSNDDDDDDDT